MENKEYLNNVLKKLSEPLPYKWKIQSYNNKDRKQATKATCVAYIDGRDVTRRMNEVCEFGYHRDHFILGNDVYCKIGLIMPDGSVIWRADAGESENDTERAKTAASDSFKRAAKEFGVGQFLYDLDVVTLKVANDGNYTNVIDDAGNKVWDITEYINKQKKKPEPKSEPAKPAKKAKSLEPGTKDWTYTVSRLKDGVSIDEIKKFIILSPENEKKLLDEAK